MPSTQSRRSTRKPESRQPQDKTVKSSNPPRRRPQKRTPSREAPSSRQGRSSSRRGRSSNPRDRSSRSRARVRSASAAAVRYMREVAETLFTGSSTTSREEGISDSRQGRSHKHDEHPHRQTRSKSRLRRVAERLLFFGSREEDDPTKIVTHHPSQNTSNQSRGDVQSASASHTVPVSSNTNALQQNTKKQWARPSESLAPSGTRHSHSRSAPSGYTVQTSYPLHFRGSRPSSSHSAPHSTPRIDVVTAEPGSSSRRSPRHSRVDSAHSSHSSTRNPHQGHPQASCRPHSRSNPSTPQHPQRGSPAHSGHSLDRGTRFSPPSLSPNFHQPYWQGNTTVSAQGQMQRNTPTALSSSSTLPETFGSHTNWGEIRPSTATGALGIARSDRSHPQLTRTSHVRGRAWQDTGAGVLPTHRVERTDTSLALSDALEEGKQNSKRNEVSQTVW